MNRAVTWFWLTGLVVVLGCRVTELPLWGPGCQAPNAVPVEQVRNIAYYDGPDADDFRHRLDIYLPKDRTDFPVVVLIHGGFWIQGDNNCCGLYPSVGQFLASQGIAVVLPNYRLSPNVKHPEHVRDVARALAWTRAHIAERGGRTDRIFLAGHSAGGHLVALLTTDETFLKAEGLSTADIRGVITISGPYRLPPGNFEFTLGGTGPNAYRFEQMMPIRLIPGPWAPLAGLAGTPMVANVFGPVFGNDPQVREQASPVNHVRPGLPPFLIISAGKDLPTLATSAAEFDRALRDQGNESQLVTVENRNHNSIMFRAIDATDPVAAAMVAFIRGHNEGR